MNFLLELKALVESSAARDESLRKSRQTIIERGTDDNQRNKITTFKNDDPLKKHTVDFTSELRGNALDYKYLDSMLKHGGASVTVSKIEAEELPNEDVEDDLEDGHVDPPIAVYITEEEAGFPHLVNESVNSMITTMDKKSLLEYINRQRRNLIKEEGGLSEDPLQKYPRKQEG